MKRHGWLFYTLAALAAGGLAALVCGDSFGDYALLYKPAFAPPAWMFPAAWTALYILMGVSAGRLRCGDGAARRTALRLWWAQLAANALWPVLFFRLGWRLPAFFWLLGLLALVLAMARAMERVDELAGWLQLPHILWLLYAAALNLLIALHN